MKTGNWITTMSGTKWFITDPSPEDVRIGDIAHALSLICRYSGHCREFYSVAEHSLRMARIANKERGMNAAMWALLHDAAEAYLGDMVRPLKQLMPEYKAIETLTEGVIIRGLGLKPVCPACRDYVKQLDDVLLMTERRDLVNHCGHEWTPRATPLEYVIVPMRSKEAYRQFLDFYGQLYMDGGML